MAETTAASLKICVVKKKSKAINAGIIFILVPFGDAYNPFVGQPKIKMQKMHCNAENRNYKYGLIHFVFCLGYRIK